MLMVSKLRVWVEEGCVVVRLHVYRRADGAPEWIEVRREEGEGPVELTGEQLVCLSTSDD